MEPAPIVLFVYNRPWHTEQTLAALSKNDLAGESVVYVFADGPKAGADAETLENIRQTRAVICGQKIFKEVIIEERSSNMGLAASIIAGVTMVVNKHGRLIVLEDDIVTSPGFLRFMNKTLDTYAADERVACISGYSYPVNGLPSTYFVKGADCWGWATWKRAWDLFSQDGQKLLNDIRNRGLGSDFDFYGTYPYQKMLEDQIEGRNNSWAIRWYASMFLLNKLCLYPGRSYVRNIGLDGSGTHCAELPDPGNVDLNERAYAGGTDVKENLWGKKLMAAHFSGKNPNWWQRSMMKWRKRNA